MSARPTVIDVFVYGAKQLCQTCLHLPSSEETASWLSAALARDYGSGVTVRYIDIDEVGVQSDNKFVSGILADQYAYPLVVIDGEVVGEGNPRLKAIRQKLEALGLKRMAYPRGRA